MNTSESASSNTRRISAWLNVTAGCVLMLLIVQFVTGAAMAFYYVPSIDHAHTTVSFIEKVLSSGSWLRSLHHYGSQWLALFVFLHLLRLRSCEAYEHAKVQWITTVILLALVMATGATGYSLPWDARAFFSTRVAEGLLAGLPFVGRVARLWLLAGTDISTLTLSRFFALHVLVTPFLIVVLVTWRIIRQSANVCWQTLTRNAIVAALVFLLLAIWSLKFPAPLGPAVNEVTADYLPRPGPQFLWLYETLKHLPGGLGSIAGVVLPGLVLLALLLVPWSNRGAFKKLSNHPQRLISTVILGGIAFWVITMTMTAYLSDRRDLRTRQQMAKQASEEKAFRSKPFTPGGLYFEDRIGPGTEALTGAPKAYLQFCSTCHGQHGEGATQGQLRFPPLIGVANKPQRTVDDIVGLLNDPTAFGLQPPMRSFATKLTEAEKKEIAEWVVKLK
jgi:ubiquinol-cytochrome c reductase cytochrome b subunit